MALCIFIMTCGEKIQSKLHDPKKSCMMMWHFSSHDIKLRLHNTMS